MRVLFWDRKILAYVAFAGQQLPCLALCWLCLLSSTEDLMVLLPEIVLLLWLKLSVVGVDVHVSPKCIKLYTQEQYNVRQFQRKALSRGDILARLQLMQ